MSSVRSITPNNHQYSMSRNLNEKSRYSLPVNANEFNQLDEGIFLRVGKFYYRIC